MKVPISRDPEKVVARILDAAEAEFMRAGYEAASTNTITQRFGGSKATLFRYFPTKQLLAEAVISRIAGSWRDRLVWPEVPVSEPEAWIAAYCRSMLAWVLSPDVLFVGRLVIAEGHKLPWVTQIFTEAASFPIERVLGERLQAWTETGELTSPDVMADVRHFLDMAISGPIVRAYYRVPPLTEPQLEDHIQRVVGLFLRGIKSR